MVKCIETSEDFKDELKKAGDKLVVVDFFATWCGPCKMIAPYIETLSGEYADKVVFLKVDVDEAEDLAGELEISSMPTFKFFKKEKEVDEMVGANREKLKEIIVKHL